MYDSANNGSGNGFNEAAYSDAMGADDTSGYMDLPAGGGGR